MPGSAMPPSPAFIFCRVCGSIEGPSKSPGLDEIPRKRLQDTCVASGRCRDDALERSRKSHAQLHVAAAPLNVGSRIGQRIEVNPTPPHILRVDARAGIDGPPALDDKV